MENMKDRIPPPGSLISKAVAEEKAVDDDDDGKEQVKESRNDKWVAESARTHKKEESMNSIPSLHSEENNESHDNIKEALDRAASSVIQSAAKALAVKEGIEQKSSETDLKLGSTKEVLASASSLLEKTNLEREKKVKLLFPSSATLPEQTTINTTNHSQMNDSSSNTESKSIGEDKASMDQVASRLNQQPGPLLRNAPLQDSVLDKEQLSNDLTKSLTHTSDIELKSMNVESIMMVKPSLSTEQEKKHSPAAWLKSDANSNLRTLYDEGSSVASSIVKVALASISESYRMLGVDSTWLDPRMPEWIKAQYTKQEDAPNKDGSYETGKSRTVIVHEIIREGWTWTTAWSPKGKYLAIATENHHLAVIDTTSSSVWRIIHDRRIYGRRAIHPQNHGTHSIRSIAWGSHFIAIGGIGNAVSILAPVAPYPVLHLISTVDFVGALDWRTDTNTLLIGSRDGKALIVKIGAHNGQHHRGNSAHPIIASTILHTIVRDDAAWVNAVKFSPSGSYFALGDSDGIVSVYDYKESHAEVMISNIANFKVEDSILSVEWSPDGKWLYAGGEDFAITIIDTKDWEAIRRIKRDKWVQFISSSYGGSHIAIGGFSNEVSILDVEKEWDSGMNVTMKGMNPLSAKWHPQDQYLVLTGQSNSILAIETTSARHVSGHFLRSVSPILAIEFSPDGCMAAIGNQAGIITIFKLTTTSFTTVYEMVLDCFDSLSIEWSPNGAFLAISTKNKVVIISRINQHRQMNSPPNSSGFAIAKVIRESGIIMDVTIDPDSRFVAVCGSKTSIFDAGANFEMVLEIANANYRSLSLANAWSSDANYRSLSLANAWSSDGEWLAMVGRRQNLVFYDTCSKVPNDWQIIFDVEVDQAGLALAWGPPGKRGLRYCAFGGEDKSIHILELRDRERSWEKILKVPRDGIIHDLDWNKEGLLAAAIDDGTVTILDLSYLRSGLAVNEMDYNWQRQALACLAEIRRNRDENCMQCVKWVPAADGSDSLLAIGGTDGEVEIIDLTARNRCTGYFTPKSSAKV